jgi:PAS domain S-box-containing protein
MPAKPPITSVHEQDALTQLRAYAAELEDQIRAYRKELEELREGHQQQRAVLDSIHAIVWEADPTTWQFTFVSDHAQAITGYAPEEWYKPGFWASHIHPDDRESALSYCHACTLRSESHDFQYRMIAADGRIIWLRDIVTVIADSGKPKMLRGVMFDVTQQCEIEHELRAHDQRLSIISQQMPAVLWSVDRDLRFTSTLGIGLEDLGLKPNENAGVPLEEYFASDPSVCEAIMAHHRRALGGESVTYRCEWGGNSYECRLEPLRDSKGACTGVIGLALDITERERAERQLQESEQRWQSIFELAIYPIWDWDMIADRSIWSPSWARLLGYDPEEFDSDVITWESVLHPDDHPQVLAKLDKYLNGKSVEYVTEYRVRTRSGGWKWVIGRGVIAARDENGKPIRMIGCVVDMTERRALEDALRNRITGESLLATVSSQFVNIASERLDDAIDDALRRLGIYANADRTYIFLFSGDAKTFSNTHEWCAKGIEPQKHMLQDLPVESFPWWMEQLRDLRPIFIPNVDEMPQSAAFEQEVLREQSVRSLIVMPMHFLGRLKGFLGFDCVRERANGDRRQWSEEDASMLGAMGNVFINAIERRRIEQSIRENERFLSTLLSNLPGWVYRCGNDRSWTYEYGSEGIKEILGYSPEQFCEGGDLSFNDLIHPDDREYVWRDVQDAIREDQPFQLIYRARDCEGSEKWLWEQGRAIKDDDGNVICIEGFISDVTERKRAEDELRRQEREFHAIVHNTPDIISRFDRELNHIYVNPVVEPLTGYSREALLNRHLNELPWPDTQRKLWRDALQQVIRQRREKVIEFELDSPAGRIFLESRLVPEFSDDGTVESVLAIARNVTMRKRAEIGLLRANETQRLLLRELDHRVRNNLASLSALIDITGRNASSITEFADSIRGRVQAMTAVHGLLSKGHWSSVSLHDLLASLIPADLNKHFDMHGPDVLVGANQCTALGMVVQELIANSLKYGALQSSEGIVRVYWKCEEPAAVAITILSLRWTEEGGPAITTVNRPGLGTNLIQGLVRTEMRGKAKLNYPPEGARHEFQLELEITDA